MPFTHRIRVATESLLLSIVNDGDATESVNHGSCCSRRPLGPNTHPSDMKLKVIAFHMLCGSTEMFAQRGTSWSSRKLPSSVVSYDGSAICQQATASGGGRDATDRRLALNLRNHVGECAHVLCAGDGECRNKRIVHRVVEDGIEGLRSLVLEGLTVVVISIVKTA